MAGITSKFDHWTQQQKKNHTESRIFQMLKSRRLNPGEIRISLSLSSLS